MAVPTSSNYPEAFDTDDNLFVVHDGLRMTLAEDYNPGDTSITVTGDALVLSRFPATGIITLTEQCSDVEDRAISFYYSSVNQEDFKFEGLEILPNFTDVIKPKRITNVTQNVMARHHNHLKDALIAIQEFLGIEGTVDTQPFGPTLEGRINFLRQLVLRPRAWFRMNKRVGLVPLTVEFTDMSFRLGTDGTAGNITLIWDFGDNDTSVVSLVSIISATDEVPDGYENFLVLDEDGGSIEKTYNSPGLYTVKLTASNDFGEDTVVFEDLIKARVTAPDEAVIRYTPITASQSQEAGVPSDGPFTTPPKIRSPINEIINIEVPEGENAATPNISFGGEALNESGNAIDPITSYIWGISDDLQHENSRLTKALFSIGGIYDLKLRVDTEFGAYRITTYEDSIDIIENTNLWMWVYTDSVTTRHYEYGLISETFKTTTVPTLTLTRDDSFLDGVAEETKQKQEFRKNAGYAQRGSTASGKQGSVLLYWASGRSGSDSASDEEITVTEFEGFGGTYISRSPISRPWNWVSFNSNQQLYFAFGGTTDAIAPSVSPTNLVSQSVNLTSLSVTTDTLTDSDLLSGATELKQNPSAYDDDGVSTYGHFSTYRSASQDNTGYFCRNDGVGPFFRLKSFYRTEGTLGSTVQTFRKLQDIQGPTKEEGEFTDLISGIYFINNSGSISAWNNSAETWSTGGPGVNSVLYRSLQDTTVAGFDDPANTLLLDSDGDRRAYISFDYSAEAFLKFSEIDLTFSSLGSRPEGTQFIMSVY